MNRVRWILKWKSTTEHTCLSSPYVLLDMLFSGIHRFVDFATVLDSIHRGSKGPLIFAWFYWLLNVTWCKSSDSYHAITPARVDNCPPIASVEEKHGQHNNFNFSFPLFKMEGNQTSVRLSLAIVTLKSWWQVLFRKVQKRHQLRCQCLWKWTKSWVDF